MAQHSLRLSLVLLLVASSSVAVAQITQGPPTPSNVPTIYFPVTEWPDPVAHVDHSKPFPWKWVAPTIVVGFFLIAGGVYFLVKKYYFTNTPTPSPSPSEPQPITTELFLKRCAFHGICMPCVNNNDAHH